MARCCVIPRSPGSVEPQVRKRFTLKAGGPAWLIEQANDIVHQRKQALVDGN